MRKIKYSELNARQKEIYNFQKVSAVFADFGYITVKLSDDWMGADFIAISFSGNKYLKVQLKGRLTFGKKYQNKNIYICFHDQIDDKWYLYPHDKVLKKVLKKIKNSKSWRIVGGFSFPSLSEDTKKILSQYLFG